MTRPIWISTKLVTDIETGAILESEGYEYSGPLALCDRGAVKQAKTFGTQAGSTASTSGSEAATERAAVIPGLVNEAQNPTGFTPQEKNRMLVASQEAAGGGNAVAGGEGELAQLRGTTAGGFAPALAEAARAKTRQLSTNALGVENADARLAEQKRQQAQQALLGLYGTDTSNMLRAMGLQDQDLATQLQAGKQGWLQDTEGILNTIGGLGSQAAGAYKALG